MINHFRTLLLNQPDKESHSESYVYIPPTFTPVKLPTPLQTVWTILYGEDLSDDELYCRTNQLMMLLHSTAMEKYVTAMDPRITYWPTNKKPVSYKLSEKLIPLSQLVSKLEPVFVASKTLLLPDHLDYELTKYCESHQYIYRLGGALIAYVSAVEDCR